MREKIRLDTVHDTVKFVEIATGIDSNVSIRITDGKDYSVNARSLMGVMYASAEFETLYLEHDGNFYHLFKDFLED